MGALSANSYAALSLRSQVTHKLRAMSTEPAQHAVAARRARAQRIHALRLRIVALGVAIFVAAWIAIFVQLETGHDPALAKALVPVATQTADPDTASGDGTGQQAWSSSAAASGDGTRRQASPAAASDPAAVTTSQS